MYHVRHKPFPKVFLYFSDLCIYFTSRFAVSNSFLTFVEMRLNNKQNEERLLVVILHFVVCCICFLSVNNFILGLFHGLFHVLEFILTFRDLRASIATISMFSFILFFLYFILCLYTGCIVSSFVAFVLGFSAYSFLFFSRMFRRSFVGVDHQAVVTACI